MKLTKNIQIFVFGNFGRNKGSGNRLFQQLKLPLRGVELGKQGKGRYQSRYETSMVNFAGILV